MRLVIETPGLYRAWIEPGNPPIIYGYDLESNDAREIMRRGEGIAIPYHLDPTRFLQDGPSHTPTA